MEQPKPGANKIASDCKIGFYCSLICRVALRNGRGFPPKPFVVFVPNAQLWLNGWSRVGIRIRMLSNHIKISLTCNTLVTQCSWDLLLILITKVYYTCLVS